MDLRCLHFPLTAGGSGAEFPEAHSLLLFTALGKVAASCLHLNPFLIFQICLLSC